MHYRDSGVRITRIGECWEEPKYRGAGTMGPHAGKQGGDWKNWKNWKNPNSRRTGVLSLTGLLFQLFQLFHTSRRPRLQVVVYKEKFTFLSLLQ